MLYQAIRLGSTIYHCDKKLSGSNDCYLALLSNLDQDKWTKPCTLDECEVEKVRNFVNVTWRARMQASNQQILCALQEILPRLNKLQGKTILDVCLDEKIDDERIGDLIGCCFDKLAKCGPPRTEEESARNQATAASKILHVINPGLFLMWDGAIIRGYGGHVNQLLYADFLRRMQMLAKFAIKQVQENESYHSDETAIASLTGCKHTLAKTLDEYNYMKFTRNCDAVWEAEYESCNSS